MINVTIPAAEWGIARALWHQSGAIFIRSVIHRLTVQGLALFSNRHGGHVHIKAQLFSTLHRLFLSGHGTSNFAAQNVAPAILLVESFSNGGAFWEKLVAQAFRNSHFVFLCQWYDHLLEELNFFHYLQQAAAQLLRAVLWPHPRQQLDSLLELLAGVEFIVDLFSEHVARHHVNAQVDLNRLKLLLLFFEGLSCGSHRLLNDVHAEAIGQVERHTLLGIIVSQTSEKLIVKLFFPVVHLFLHLIHRLDLDIDVA